jgi:CHAT domain-containing protein
LTRPFDKHLDSDELDSLVSLQGTSVSEFEQLSELDLGEAKRHVESCQDCSRKLRRHGVVHSEILRMRAPNPSPSTSECMGDAEWLEVAAGLLAEAKTRELMKHAAQCGHCGPLLKNAAESLVDEATPSEEALLASLQSASPDWQAQMAEALRRTGEPLRAAEAGPSFWSGLFFWLRPAFAAAALAVLIAAVWIGVRWPRPAGAEELIAQAYTEQRTIDVRIRGAKYSPVRTDRGPTISNYDRPVPLQKADAVISENLLKNPGDPGWLQAKANADMLEGRFDDAVKRLQRAIDSKPDSPELLTDLGSAYFLRGRSNRPADIDKATPSFPKSLAQNSCNPANSPHWAVDYMCAIDSFGKALMKNPDDPVALFNRALALGDVFLYAPAVDDWQHYLRIDPQGDWSAEARERLTNVKHKVIQRENSLSEPMLTPEDIARADANSQLEEKIDERIEEYLKVATKEWLPKAFPGSGYKPSREASTALTTLSAVAARRHEDMWLVDLLNHSRGPQFSEATQTLSESIKSNERGDYIAGRTFAQRAAELFLIASNSAGQLRALGEEVYSDHLLWEGTPCLSLLNTMHETLQRTSYTWLEGQMSLETSNCAELVGDLGEYERAISLGETQAKAHNYDALYLRGLGFEAQAAASLGKTSTSFSLALYGLERFWTGRADLMKGYNFYTDLDAAADVLHLANLQVDISRQATDLIDEHPDAVLRAMAHRWYGYAAYSANMPALASSEFSKASALFAAAPHTTATTRDRMNAEIWLARLELRRGDVESAAARLQAAKQDLDESPSFGNEMGLYTSQADIGLFRSDSSATESALRPAVFLAEWALNSFPSDGDRRMWAEQTRDIYRDLVEWKLRDGDERSALELWEWYKGAELRARVPRTSEASRTLDTSDPPNPNDAPPLPAPLNVAPHLLAMHNETGVVYAAFPDGIAVWTYDDRGVVSHWISTPSTALKQIADRFGWLCSNPGSDLDALRRTSRSLYDLLIRPIEGQITNGRTLIIEPDDFLAPIAWQALLDANGRYLIERSAIVLSPGLYRMMALRTSTAITFETGVLIISVPRVAEEGLMPLTDVDTEAEAVARSFRAASRLQGTDATLSAIQREMPGKAILHFAGHAVASAQRTGLLLDEMDPKSQEPRVLNSESLSPHQVADLQLAVLSACQTEASGVGSSTGTEGLTQRFLNAGVPHIVASRWDVDSSETARLMKIFYARLLAGEDVANSLRHAQSTLITMPASAHPYYWAAFELEGTK